MDWAKVPQDLTIGIAAGLVSPVLLFVLLRPRIVISPRISIQDDRRRIKLANYGYRHAAEVSLELTLHYQADTQEHVAFLQALSTDRIALFPRRRLLREYPGGKSKRPNRLIILGMVSRDSFTEFGYGELPDDVRRDLDQPGSKLTPEKLMNRMDPTGKGGVHLRLTMTCADGWTNFRRTCHRDFRKEDVTTKKFKKDGIDIADEHTHFAGWFG